MLLQLSRRAIERITQLKQRNGRKPRKRRLCHSAIWAVMANAATGLQSIIEANRPAINQNYGQTAHSKELSRKDRAKSREKRKYKSEATGQQAQQHLENGSGRAKIKKSPSSKKPKKPPSSSSAKKGRQWTELGRNVDATRPTSSESQPHPPETRSPESVLWSKGEEVDADRATSTDFYDTDFETDAVSTVDENGLEAYKIGCQVLGIMPQTKAIEQWSGPVINLNYRNLGPSGAKALTSALTLNSHVNSLELQENRLGGIGGMYIATYLRQNLFITHLNLAQNNLGSMGAMAIAEILQTNRTLKHLDLADNNFRDSDGDHLAKAIEMAEQLRSLNLSNNGFSEEGATRLGRAIGRNDSLERIDMSWNQLRRKGAGAVCAGVKRNTNMSYLNIAWNGLGYEGSIGIGEMLRKNHYLHELDISSNRINWEGAVIVSKGLASNNALEILKIGKNPLTMTGCRDILEAIGSNPKSRLEILSFEDVPINKDIVSLIENLEARQDLEVIHGGVVDSIDVIGARKDVKKDPIQVLLEFLTSRGIRPVDLFRSLKQDDKNMVSKEAFLQGLQNAKVPMHQRQIESILNTVETDSNGKISFNLLMKGVKDQIKVNREEEKKRMDQEDKFNEERKRLMALTPPNEKRGKKKRQNQSRATKTTETTDWSDSEWVTEEETEILHESFNNSEDALMVNSRSVTPAPSNGGYVRGKQRQLGKDRVSLPGIAMANHAQLSRSRHQLTRTDPVQAKGQRNSQKGLSLLETQKVYQERSQMDAGQQCQHDLQIDARIKKPQRLLPLPSVSSEPLIKGSKGRLPHQKATSKSVDSWMDTEPKDSILESAMFSQSLRAGGVKLQPLPEKADLSKAQNANPIQIL